LALKFRQGQFAAQLLSVLAEGEVTLHHNHSLVAMELVDH
jgi:hypothetical protein